MFLIIEVTDDNGAVYAQVASALGAAVVAEADVHAALASGSAERRFGAITHLVLGNGRRGRPKRTHKVACAAPLPRSSGHIQQDHRSHEGPLPSQVLCGTATDECID